MISVRYTCRGQCGIRDRKIVMRERGKKEDVAAWQAVLRSVVSLDHELMAPRCPAEEADVTLPDGTCV